MYMRKLRVIFVYLLCAMLTPVAYAEKLDYKPSRVVYDVADNDAVEIKHILDRVSLLQNVYGNDPFESSIVLVIHEQAIPFFTKNGNNRHKEIEERAASLATGEIIQFRVCRTSARMQNLTEKDFNSFIKLVPMADAEIIKLQNDGYAYMK